MVFASIKSVTLRVANEMKFGLFARTVAASLNALLGGSKGLSEFVCLCNYEL